MRLILSTIAIAIGMGGSVQHSMAASANAIDIIEFYNTTLGHYFITNPTEAALIDAGNAGPGWLRTGRTFKGADGAASGFQATCRFYTVGANSHFYAAEGPECDYLKSLNPENALGADLWTFEGNAFYVQTPSAGSCPAGSTPVYRLYNNKGGEHDSNHRFTTDTAISDLMVSNGWSLEGIAMCAGEPDDSTSSGNSGSGTTTESGNGCLNPALASQPYTAYFEHRETDTVNGVASIMTGSTDISTNPASSFNGSTALESHIVYRIDNAQNGFQYADIYNYQRYEGLIQFTLGGNGESHSLAGVQKTTTLYNVPLRSRRFELAIGETDHQTYTVTVSVDIGNGSPSSSTYTLSDYVTYLGREAVTVPAGTFETCKFDEGGRNIAWYDIRTGIQVKALSETGNTSQLIEMTYGKFNGVQMR